MNDIYMNKIYENVFNQLSEENKKLIIDFKIDNKKLNEHLKTRRNITSEAKKLVKEIMKKYKIKKITPQDYINNPIYIFDIIDNKVNIIIESTGDTKLIIKEKFKNNYIKEVTIKQNRIEIDIREKKENNKLFEEELSYNFLALFDISNDKISHINYNHTNIDKDSKYKIKSIFFDTKKTKELNKEILNEIKENLNNKEEIIEILNLKYDINIKEDDILSTIFSMTEINKININNNLKP